MTDDQKPEEPSKFQWLKSYWKNEEEQSGHSAKEESSVRTERPTHGGFRVPRWYQLRQLPGTFSPRERLIARGALAVACICIIVLGIRFYQHHSVYIAKPGGSYTEGLLGEPKFLNPVLAFSNDVDLDLSHLVFSGLYEINAKGEVEHALASSEKISMDGTTYTISLRRNVQWHDGELLTADDVVFTFDRILDPATQSPYYKIFRDLKVSASDDHTIVMTLPKPYAPFLSTLTIGIIPAHIWQEVPPDNMSLAEYNVKPVGTGPYEFQSLTKDRNGTIKSYHLIRFKNFFATKPNLNDLTFRFYPTMDEAMTGLQQKHVQGLGFVTNDEKTALKKRQIAIRDLRLPQYTAIFYNQRTPMLKDKTVRQALERAVDKKKIVQQALNGAGEVIHSPILPGFLGYNKAVQGLAFDPETAKKDLTDAGWTQTGTAVRQKKGQELRMSISTVDRPEYTKTAELLKKYWAAIGVGTDIKLYSSSDILKKVIKPRDYDALLFGEIIGTDPDPYPFWHSSQNVDPGLNLAIFTNKEVDKLLEEARQTNDLEKRRLAYLHFQNILAEAEPALFLYNPYYSYGLPTKIQGFVLRRIATPSDRFNGIESWFIKTKHAWK